MAAISSSLRRSKRSLLRQRCSRGSRSGCRDSPGGLPRAGSGHDQHGKDPGNLPAVSNQCTGPLGSLLPECQAGKSGITIPAPAQSGVGAAVPSIKTRDSENPAEREPSLPPVPPEPPTEFQLFAASSVGRVLPIFGAKLFAAVPTTFAPLDRVPVTADYVIGPGDEILLRVWGQVNLDVSLSVDRASSVFIPQAGTSMSPACSSSSFLPSSAPNWSGSFETSISPWGWGNCVPFRSSSWARRAPPGSYTVSSLSTLVNALFASGGPSAQGSMRRIQLKRGAAVQPNSTCTTSS